MNLVRISVSDEIYDVCPEFVLGVIECKVVNSNFDQGLWAEIHAEEAKIAQTLKMEEVNKIPTILATRKAYKALGKDPNRYRPSAEALNRRIVKGLGIYQIDTLVDLINLVSIRTGYSIGGFDADKIEGNLTLGVGQKDEHFEAIGRGALNIDGLPVYRDEIGGIGTPTSDEERTKISAETCHLLMLINGYSGKSGINETVDWTSKLLKKHAHAENLNVQFIEK